MCKQICNFQEAELSYWAKYPTCKIVTQLFYTCCLYLKIQTIAK